MKCPHCGAGYQAPGRTCGNCGKEIREFPGRHKECRSCHQRIIYGVEECPYCGARDGAEDDADRVLASHEFGPLAAPLQTFDVKLYEDNVVTEQEFHITHVRSVTTAKRSVWRAGNVLASIFLMTISIALLSVWGMTGSSFPLIFGLLFGAGAVYQVVMFILLETEASQRTDDPKDEP